MISRLVLALALGLSAQAAAESRTKVLVNGAAMPVFFNDGDSFRVVEGPLLGTKARLAGFNTLESHGPVHQWGDWTAWELYVLAKMATLNGRRGTWSCSWDRDRDTYGRGLFICPQLAEDQIRKGLAHAMTVTAEPSRPDYLAAQREAIAGRRGIWAHGVPEYVLTSLHSASERPDQAYAYNRLVSTADGHSEMWQHRDDYSECQRVCAHLGQVPADALARGVAALDQVEEIAGTWRGLPEADKHHVLRLFGSLRSVAALVPREERDLWRPHLTTLADSGGLPVEENKEVSCMVYVDYKRRYGNRKAPCLKTK